MTRHFVGLVLALALGVMGCGETAGTGGSGGDGGSAGMGGGGGSGGDAALPEVRFVTQNLNDYWPCFSIDGDAVVFSRKGSDDAPWELWSVPVEGGTAAPFSREALPVAATRTSASSVGDRYAFTGVWSTGAQTLWTIQQDGSAAEQIMMDDLSTSVFYPSFYPGGESLVVVDFAGGIGGVLRMVDFGAGLVVAITERAEVLAGMPAVSPGGRTIAFAGQRNDGQIYDQTQNSILFVEANGDVVAPDEGQGRTPAWSPDGLWVAFESERETPDDMLIGTQNPRKRYAVFVMHPDGTDVRRLTDPALDANHPVFSPDGAQIAFSAIIPDTDDQSGGIAIIEFDAGL